MNQQDKQSVENIYKAFQLLPDNKREYLMGVADGMAAMAVAATAGSVADATPPDIRPSA